MSKDELDKIIPVNPPIVNKKINPNDHNIGGLYFIGEPWIVAIQEKKF